ncbi:MAG: hypothetical protein QMD10_13020 [Desulfitobacteriaceae bacterium]|nr:hypothetical protein [Desulfitobacteriaceae bacterium]
MVWKMYIASYELHSPLHIGYHKIGNLQRTRYYIPARNLWGAVTETLTRRGFAEQILQQSNPVDYQAVGRWVEEHCAFGYWFIVESHHLLSPHYEKGELKYGNLSLDQFERRYLKAHVTTALEAATTSAAEGSLHEVEYLSPYTPEGRRTQIKGVFFLDEEAQRELGEKEKWQKWLGVLQIGGERRYGFGQLRLEDISPATDDRWQLEAKRPRYWVEKNKPLPAHTLASEVKACGQIEPLLGRQTSGDSANFGRSLVMAQICWAPGSMIEEETYLQVSPNGIWQRPVE